MDFTNIVNNTSVLESQPGTRNLHRSGQMSSSGIEGYEAGKALCTAVSEINPYTAPRGAVAEYREQVQKQLEQGGYYVGWDTEKLKRRLVDLMKFKKSPTWKVVGGEHRIAENKFLFKEGDLIGLVALLEKVVVLREDAEKDKEEKTQAKRKREDAFLDLFFMRQLADICGIHWNRPKTSHMLYKVI